MVKRRHLIMRNKPRAMSIVDDEILHSDRVITEIGTIGQTFKQEVQDKHDKKDFGKTPLREEIDDFYLLCGDQPISITELQLINSSGAAVGISRGSKVIYLHGKTRSRLEEVKLRAEMWTLWAMGKHYGPRFSIKTPNGWTQLARPRPVYRRIMNDGLTLAHLVYYIGRTPNGSGDEARTYMENEFRIYGERPALHKLPSFYPVVKTYFGKDAEEGRIVILKDLFPEQFCQDSCKSVSMQEIDLNRSSSAFSGLEENHEGLEESHEEIRFLEYHHISQDSGPPPSLIEDLKETIEILKQINRSDSGIHKSVKDDLYELPPRSTLSFTTYGNHLRPSQSEYSGSEFDIEPRNWIAQNDEMVEHAKASGHAAGSNSDVDPKKRKRGRPPGTKKNIRKVDNSKLDDPPICVLCDDGGDLLCCEGPCQRYFHAVESTTGQESRCETLGLTKREVKAIKRYLCKNCRYQKHQCFICGELGSSAPSSVLGHQEVFACQASVCRRLYHPECVAKATISTSDWKSLAENIQRRLEGFQCPRHTCLVCKTEELKPGRLVQCRRCPKAWHLDCIEDYSLSHELPETQIWKHFKRRFFFCKDHRILPELQTPDRDHIKFPESAES